MHEIQLSPGSYCTRHANRVDKKTREYKKKRRETREGRNSKIRQLENREGTQYESGLRYRKESLESEIEIPPPSCCSPPQVQKVPATSGLRKVVIDLETSSRGTNNMDYLFQ